MELQVATMCKGATDPETMKCDLWLSPQRPIRRLVDG
jgi:hypothetical protein